MPPSSPSGRTPGLRFEEAAYLDLLDGFEEPALLYLPGGRIWAANRAAVELAECPLAGTNVDQLLERLRVRGVDGCRIARGDLPYARALRGEIVAQGERVAMVRPGGGDYAALVTSVPILIDGEVVAALSIWHDFDAYARELTRETASPGPLDATRGPRPRCKAVGRTLARGLKRGS